MLWHQGPSLKFFRFGLYSIYIPGMCQALFMACCIIIAIMSPDDSFAKIRVSRSHGAILRTVTLILT